MISGFKRIRSIGQLAKKEALYHIKENFKLRQPHFNLGMQAAARSVPSSITSWQKVESGERGKEA